MTNKILPVGSLSSYAETRKLPRGPRIIVRDKQHVNSFIPPVDKAGVERGKCFFLIDPHLSFQDESLKGME